MSAIDNEELENIDGGNLSCAEAAGLAVGLAIGGAIMTAASGGLAGALVLSAGLHIGAITAAACA